jgi:hypothetical protein
MVQYSEEYENMRKICISQPCYKCRLNHKGTCLLTPDFQMDNLDYLKALFDLNEEFPT